MNEHDMSAFWHWWVVILTLANIAGIYWLIRWTSKKRPGEAAEGAETGHSWDGLTEFNNPLPRWWLWMFYITIVFALVYLVLYPGLGRFAGLLGWHSGNMLGVEDSQYQREMQRAEERYQPIFAAMADQDISSLARDADAVTTGRRLYLNYCSTCHGSDAGGARGFPSLVNGVWQWGGTPDAIRTSIAQGREANMPGFGDSLGEEGVEQVAHYVLQMSGRDDADSALAEEGQQRYNMFCAGCHGADGAGMAMLGAPSLTENVWIYGGSLAAIKETIEQGRAGVMPGFQELLGEERVHVLSAYVYSLDPQ
ncbi:cytochrome-c oxidase, cbb3-type subunit III [Thioalkalivibrio sp.]|uniref:cytochrome-c oxidase, cbb3-type subunit III n=1 Tax=Thioalkalivibrio sp. TaxID=2093813 RepID=UPI0012D6D345|nr:cytochrome-c oxidase, cbb3-type subunit III [Thioalkalivibrio sp.]TVP76749.1 MAG: cytochrome-c oxidase, cbb3-type subunit III [Thioalkalivibrio sp.]